MMFIVSEAPQLIYPNRLQFGDLQSMCNLTSFKEKTPNIIKLPLVNQNSTILCYGDSLLATNYGYKPFGHQLQDKLQSNVSSHISLHEHSLQSIKHQLNLYPKTKVLILENIEKYLYGRNPNSIRLKLFHIDSLFTKRDHKFQNLFKQSFLFQKFMPAISDFKFEYFGDFPSKQLIYKEDRLYLKSTLSNLTLGSDFSPIQSKQVDSYVKHLVRIKDYLDTVGIQLLVMIVPNKATVEKPIKHFKSYQHIQSIQAKLKSQSIHYVDLVSAFKNNNNLFFRSDSHWNKNGVKIAVNETSKKLLQFSQK